MRRCFSTFKKRSLDNSNDNNATTVLIDLNFQSSNLNFKPNFHKDCVEYDGFLEEMEVLINKVDSNDLSDFEEF